MTARLLRLAVGLLLALAVAWFVHWWHQGSLVIAALGAVLILAVHVPVLAVEFLVMHAFNRHDPAPRARWGELVSAWWAECRLGWWVFAWQQPFRSHAEPDHLDVALSGQRGVLLIHGFMCNRGMWNRWMPRLRELGIPFMAVNLEPTFGAIEGYAPTIEEAVQRLKQLTGRPPLILAHSMGGLATRTWMRTRRKLGRAADVHHVVTLGTPHGGTLVGALNPAANVVQMRHGSPWLAQLGEGEPQPARHGFTCFYSHCDNIVFPASAATLHGAQNHHLRATAHMQLIERPEVIDAVLALLQRPD